jgi:hypothetical protein
MRNLSGEVAMFKFLPLGLKVYSWVYLIFSILTALYFLLGLVILLFFTGSIPAEILRLGGGLIFNFLTFLVWYRIFKTLFEMFDGKGVFKINVIQMKKNGILFFISFIIDVARFSYSSSFLTEPPIDWSKVYFPSLSDPIPTIIYGGSQMFFKMTVYFSGFLTPTTVGLASVFLGLFCFYISKREADRAG